MKMIFSLLCIGLSIIADAQDDLLSLIEDESDQKKEFVTNAFKSTRVINGHSMELLGKGVMDVRILHRFGTINSGFKNLYGLDQANMRLGFDYGVTNNLTIGFGRSNVGKEWDGFIKIRPLRQSRGRRSSPVSIVIISGITATSQSPVSVDSMAKEFLSNRLAYYNELVIGRKFSERFSMQVSPVFVHRNIVASAAESNDTYALGLGARYKLSKRVAFVVDYHYILYGLDKNIFHDPLSIGFDIETGGHVFQLHFSNATGMNERALICNTTGEWGKGEIRFGFNLSRVFTVSHKQRKN